MWLFSLPKKEYNIINKSTLAHLHKWFVYTIKRVINLCIKDIYIIITTFAFVYISVISFLFFTPFNGYSTNVKHHLYRNEKWNCAMCLKNKLIVSLVHCDIPSQGNQLLARDNDAEMSRTVSQWKQNLLAYITRFFQNIGIPWSLANWIHNL